MRQPIGIIRTIAIAGVWLALTSPSFAADLYVHPLKVELVGPNVSQRLLVFDYEKSHAVADRSAKAKFTSADPTIATVDASGVVRPVADGKTKITAAVDGQTAVADVTVRRAKDDEEWSFRNHIIPLMTKAGCNSGACHGALAGKGGFRLSLRGFDPEADHFTLTRQVMARRIDSTSPDQSLALKKATKQMPHGGGKRFDTDSEEQRRFLGWIKAGAKLPAAEEPHVVRLEVLPDGLRLKPKDEFSVIVRAFYSDGKVDDITAWTRFISTGESVVTVDDQGRAKVIGAGEAAVIVNYANLVAAAVVTVPFETIPGAPRSRLADGDRCLIDRAVDEKLGLLNYWGQRSADDPTFIRRAFIDAIGTLPTPTEVDAFLADQRDDRRARLIESLLARPEYVDYWSYKWSDLLLVSSRQLSGPAMWSFHRAIRRAVADNMPWDQFAREMLTAKGGTMRSGLGNFFLVHREPTELAESTAVTFLGLSIACAKCHNHPLEKWTQDQYWGFANLFGRAGLKSGDGSGDVNIVTLASGDVLHQRRGIAMLPTPLDFPALALNDARDRREYLADWLTKPENPYFAKAIVNRVWKNFMGRGLVEAEDDLRLSNPATHPELLNSLAAEFVKHKYDIKWLIRLIMNSETYQRRSAPVRGDDNDDRFLAHYVIRRLPAEVLLDAYSQITGVPTPFDQVGTKGRADTAKTDQYPLGLRAQQLPDTLLVSRFLDAFGRPPRELVCSCERQADGNVGQALHLANGSTLNEKLRNDKSIVNQWLAAKTPDEEIVSHVFRSALSRAPTDKERAASIKSLAEAGNDRRAAIEDLLWAVLTSREFLFNH